MYVFLVQPSCPLDLYLENGSPCLTQSTQSLIGIVSASSTSSLALSSSSTTTITTTTSTTVVQKNNNSSSSQLNYLVENHKSLCYQGRCPTRHSQCEMIWGEQATEASDYCFHLHNTKTDGACGVQGQHCTIELVQFSYIILYYLCLVFFSHLILFVHSFFVRFYFQKDYYKVFCIELCVYRGFPDAHLWNVFKYKY